MPRIKSETIYNDAFPNRKHVFTFNFDTGSNTFTAPLPPWMAEAIGTKATEPKKTLEEADTELRNAIILYAQRDTKTELVIAAKYSNQPDRFERGALAILVRARLMIRTTTTFRGGQKTKLDSYDFRPADPTHHMGSRFEEERWKRWKRLDLCSYWNCEHEEDVHILEHTPELEAYFLGLADALTAAQDRLAAIFDSIETIKNNAAAFHLAQNLPPLLQQEPQKPATDEKEELPQH